MSTATVPDVLAAKPSAGANERNLDLLQEHLDALLEEDAPAPDPVSVFLPAADPEGFADAIALASAFARDGHDVDLRHVRPGRPGERALGR